MSQMGGWTFDEDDDGCGAPEAKKAKVDPGGHRICSNCQCSSGDSGWAACTKGAAKKKGAPAEDACFLCYFFRRKHLSRWMTFPVMAAIHAAGGQERQNISEGLATMAKQMGNGHIGPIQPVRYEGEVRQVQRNMIWLEESVPYLCGRNSCGIGSASPQRA